MRTEPKQERVQKTIEHILNTAEKLFAKKGYEKVSTNLIAKEAGLAIGSLYRYFSNKTAIMEHLMRKYIQIFLENLKKDDSKQKKWTIDELNKNFFANVEKTLREHPSVIEIIFIDMETPKMKELDESLLENIDKAQADKYQKINPRLPRKEALKMARMVNLTFRYHLFEAKKASEKKREFDPIIKEESKKMILAYLKLCLAK